VHGAHRTAADGAAVFGRAGTLPESNPWNRTQSAPEGANITMTDDLPPPLLKPADVARVLNVTVTQVYALMRGGELPALKIGKKGVWRVSREALEAYLAELEAESRSRSTVTEPLPD
jgi:excisionase family DNA binding protein